MLNNNYNMQHIAMKNNVNYLYCEAVKIFNADDISIR